MLKYIIRFDIRNNESPESKHIEFSDEAKAIYCYNQLVAFQTCQTYCWNFLWDNYRIGGCSIHSIDGLYRVTEEKIY